MLIVHKLSFTHKLPLAIHDTSHFTWETLPCVMMPTKYKRRNKNHQTNDQTTKLTRNYSETGEPWNSEITPKSLRNYGPGLWYSKITPKSFRNYSETTPKLGNRGTMELLLNQGTVEFRNYSETMGLGPWPWNSENCGLLQSSIGSGLLVCLPRPLQAD